MSGAGTPPSTTSFVEIVPPASMAHAFRLEHDLLQCRCSGLSGPNEGRMLLPFHTDFVLTGEELEVIVQAHGGRR